MNETLNSGDISTRLLRIAKLAREDRSRVFMSIAHVIDVEWMREAYRRTRKDGALGVDGQTADEFAGNLEANLKALVDGLHSGRYKAPPVRRVQIPKGEGKTRPIGIPTFADKVMQKTPTPQGQRLTFDISAEFRYAARHVASFADTICRCSLPYLRTRQREAASLLEGPGL